MKKLNEVFDPKLNGLNAVRLVLALGVIVYHSFPITGTPITNGAAKQLSGSLFVDSFFAISGYLILSSWIRRPRWRTFLRARVLRIAPAFYACLILTGLVFGPLSILLSGIKTDRNSMIEGGTYVLRNSLLRVVQYDIPGTLGQVPYPNVWNGSMWTLWWEFLCYLAVLGLGVVGLLQRRVTVPGLFVFCLVGLVATAYGPVENAYAVHGARFGLMFFAGAMVYEFQDRIPADWRLVTLASAVVIGSSWLPDYRLIAAIPVAYVVITIGAMIKSPRLRLPNDVSYGTYIYAFPLQQLLASAGLAALNTWSFAVLSISVTLPAAAASWFLVERPALRFKSRRKVRPRDLSVERSVAEDIP